MFGQLGQLVFEGVQGPEGMTLQGDEIYAELPLINRRPKLDHTGTGLNNLSLCIQFHFSFCTPETNIKTLWSYKENAVILPFILGNGRLVGEFVILSITERPTQMSPEGNYICVKVDVILKEVYAVSKKLQYQQSAKYEAIALSENGPTPVRARSTEWITNMWKATEAIMRVKTIAAAIQNVIKYASVPEFWAVASQQLGVYAAIAINSHQALIDEMLVDSSLETMCPGLNASTLASLALFTGLIASLPISDHSVIEAQGNTLQTAAEAMQLIALPIFTAIIFRN